MHGKCLLQLQASGGDGGTDGETDVNNVKWREGEEINIQMRDREKHVGKKEKRKMMVMMMFTSCL